MRLIDGGPADKINLYNANHNNTLQVNILWIKQMCVWQQTGQAN